MNRIRKMITVILILPVTGLLAQTVSDRGIHYRYGDWVSYPVMRFASSVALGHNYAYFSGPSGIMRYDFYRDQWDEPMTFSDGLEGGAIQIVAYDLESGTLWCAALKGINYWVEAAEEWYFIPYSQIGGGRAKSLGSGHTYLWIETGRGVYKSDRNVWMFSPGSEQEMQADRVKWSGRRSSGRVDPLPDLFMENGGLFFPDGYIQDFHLRRFDVKDNIADRFNRIWMAIWGLGGSFANTLTYDCRLLPFGPFTGDMEAMGWDDSGMWIGGRNPRGERGGITWWDMEREEWQYFESAFIGGLNSDEVWSIAADENDVWFGTSEGLARYVKKDQSWRTYTSFDNLWDERVNSIVFAGGDIWAGTAMGINRIEWPSMVITQVRDKPLIRRWIYQLEFDGVDLWAGTDRGLYRFQNLQGSWQYVKCDPSMLVEEVTAISSHGNEIWFGTNDGVACYYADEDRWEGFPARHNPTGGMIHTIMADSAHVWVGKENGLLKYVKRENRWHRYSRADGLLDNSVRWILLDGDYIWLGTGRGLTRFYWNAPHLID